MWGAEEQQRVMFGLKRMLAWLLVTMRSLEEGGGVLHMGAASMPCELAVAWEQQGQHHVMLGSRGCLCGCWLHWTVRD
jgi:hypothetical protein